MNEWQDMEEELKQAQAQQNLGETKVLDASNVHHQPFADKNLFNQGYDHAADQSQADFLAGDKQQLQESSLMTFEDQQNREPKQKIVDINHQLGNVGIPSRSKIASVTITDFDWQYENFGFGYYQYVVTTCLKTQEGEVQVRRRYTEFHELYKLLQLEDPGCIVPPLPPKTAVTKLKGKESEEAQDRKVGLTKFLQMLAEHPLLCQSAVLEAFLIDSSSEQFTMAKYIQQVDGQFSKAYLLDCAEVFQEEAAIGDFQTQGVSALLQQTNKVFKDTIWGSQKEQMSDAFGGFLEQAKEELTTFKRQEDYLDSLGQAYSGLIASVTAQISTQQETSQNLVQMAGSFQKVRQMRGAENSQVTQAICNISNPFNQAAITSNQVADQMRDEVLSIVVFDQSFLGEARRMFLRWRALVTRYYILVNQVQSYADSMQASGDRGPLGGGSSSDTENQARSAERDAIRDMMPGIKQRIIDEIDLFQNRFNRQTQIVVQRYTELHQQSAQIQLKYWQDYLSEIQGNN